ncbi:MAG: DUF421 domain-containing protein [Bacillaceae bacterium]|nr:DUF421 domain-containing protein [Bacillaceae bacterium]
MLLYAGKVILLFVLTIVLIRLMGKSAISQLTPHDLTAIVFVVTLAVTPIVTEQVGRTIAGIMIVAIIHILMSKMTLFRKFNRYILGEPTILIKHGKIIKSNLERSRFSLVELLSNVRAAGYPDIEKIDYALLEPTGEISIIPKKDLAPLTPRHLNLNVEYQGLPLSVVVEGKIQEKNLELIHKDKTWLMERLAELGVEDLEQILYASVNDKDHSLTVDTGKGEKYN